MLTTDQRTFVVRNHILSLIGLSMVAWHSQATDEMIADFKPHEMAPMNPLDVKAITDELPQASDLEKWERLIFRVGEVMPALGYEDRAYVAIARSHLFDAVADIRDCDFDQAWDDIDAAARRLRWVVYERRREGSRSNVVLHEEPRIILLDLADDVDAMAAAVADVRRVLQ